MANIKDITGKRFGKLVAIKSTGKTQTRNGFLWLCKCDCGNYIEAPVGRLNGGSIRACKDCTKINHQQATKVALSRKKEKLYGVWKCMKQRCKNPNNSHYRFYGERNIKVCDEWNDSYSAFRNWAYSNGYKEGLSIERIDVNGNYQPDNCTWINLEDQAYNTRRTHYIIYDNIKIPIAKMIHDLGLPYKIVIKYFKSYKRSTTNLL